LAELRLLERPVEEEAETSLRPARLEKPVQRRIKRALDIAVSGLGLLWLGPSLGLISLAIKLDSPGSLLFNRPRIGRNGQPFVMYKFRTMHDGAEHKLRELAHLNEGGCYMIKIPNDPRVTRIGRVLRRTSLDEFPQLVNVLKGDMSLVGPRPQAPNEVALYTDRQRRRLEVLPGITGLWQVTSRNDPSFERWVQLDIEYIDSWSLKKDVLILLKTVGAVLKANGGRTKSSAAKK
jgi:lipopolysaccharide/colanic/teichoic acid biosynthesis glycosyltransferase